MAESVNGGTSGTQPPKEMSMEVRLLLAFLLMGVVMFLTPYLFKTQPPAPVKKAEQTTSAPAPGGESSGRPRPPPPRRRLPRLPLRLRSHPRSRPLAATPVCHRYRPLPRDFQQSGSHGSQLAAEEVQGERQQAARPDEPRCQGRLSLLPLLPRSEAHLERQLGVVQADPRPRRPGCRLRVFRRAHRGSQVVPLREEQLSLARHQHRNHRRQARGQPAPVARRIRRPDGGQPPEQPANAVSSTWPTTSSSRRTPAPPRTAPSPRKATSPSPASPIPTSPASSFRKAAPLCARLRLPIRRSPRVWRNRRSSAASRFPPARPASWTLFVGPKDLKLLSRINPKLVSVVDFGWLSVLAKPLFLVVNWFNESFVHNYGWSIVVVTIIINFILFPLKLSNMKSMRKMQALKPQIDAINEKYKNLKMTRSEEGRSEPGGDGSVQEVRRQPHGRLRPHAAADSVLLRVLQGLHAFRWRCAAPVGFG